MRHFLFLFYKFSLFCFWKYEKRKAGVEREKKDMHIVGTMDKIWKRREEKKRAWTIFLKIQRGYREKEEYMEKKENVCIMYCIVQCIVQGVRKTVFHFLFSVFVIFCCSLLDFYCRQRWRRWLRLYKKKEENKTEKKEENTVEHWNFTSVRICRAKCLDGFGNCSSNY